MTLPQSNAARGDRSRAGFSSNSPSAKTIQHALVSWLRWSTHNVVMGNVFVQGSPWEADVIAVTKAYYWHEYEIKVSVADFRNDFQKRVNGYSRRSQRKHDVYTCGDVVACYGRQIPRPKSFSFVVPKGLLDDVEVPNHCRIIEYDKDWGYWHVRTKRVAPTLRNATKLSQAQIFNLARKAASKVLFQNDTT